MEILLAISGISNVKKTEEGIMNFSKRWQLFLLVILFSPPCLVAQPGFKAGFSEKDITPSTGMEIPGGYGKSYNSGQIHDSLKARAVVFDDGDELVALVGIDALTISEHLTREVRKRIHDACGIPENAILIAASHTHTGGPGGWAREDDFAHSSEFVKDLAFNHSTMGNNEYIQKMQDAVAGAVVQAYQQRMAAKASVGSGYEDKVAFNRRFVMKNGLTWTHPSGFSAMKNPDIIEAAGPVDPEVAVLGVWDQEDNLMGCIVNYASHCTNGMPGISADYVFYIEKTIRGVMGEEVVVVFLQGASGDITQVNNLGTDNTESGVRSARFVGTSIGAEALKVLTRAEPGDLLPVKYVTKKMTIPRRKPSPERVKTCMEIVQQTPEQVGHTTWTFAKEIVLLDAMARKEPQKTFEIQAIQVGPAVFIANPAEMFCQTGLDIKAQSEFPFTFVVELANGMIGYVPTDEAFKSDGGGYETRLTSYSNLEIDASNQIRDASVELANSLKPGDVPQPPQKGPHQGPWDYGNVKPELD